MKKGCFKLNDTIFTIALISFIIKQVSGYSLLPSIIPMYGGIVKMLEMVIVFLFFLYAFIINYSIKRLIIGSIVFLSLLVAYKSGAQYIFFVGMLLFMSLKIEYKKIVKITIITLFGIVAIVVGLCIIGIIPNKVFSHTLANGKIENSYALGFDYYSSIPIYILFSTCMYFMLRKEKCKWIEIVIMSIIVLIVNEICHKQLTFILNIGVIVIYIILSKIKIISIKNYIIKIGLMLIVPISFFSILFCSSNYYKYDFTIVDKLLSGRLKYGYQTMNDYSINLLGSKINMVGSSVYVADSNVEYFYIDSGYLQLLYLYGLIATILIIMAYTMISYKAIKDENIELIIFVSMCGIYNILGSTLLEVWYNPLLFIGVKYILNDIGTLSILGKKYRVVWRR